MFSSKTRPIHSRLWQHLVVASVLFAGTASAQTLTLNMAIYQAQKNAPALRASSAQISAAESTALPAGTLPNPKLFAGLENFPITGDAAWSFTRESMTMQKVGVMQDFPNAAKRQAKVALAETAVDAAKAQTSIIQIGIQQAAATAWFKRFYLERKLHFMMSCLQTINC